ELRAAEMARKARPEAPRVADRIERQPIPTPPPMPVAASMESAAHAAVAAALLPPTAIEDVSIRPMPLKPSLFEPANEPVAEAPLPQTFIPPMPDRSYVQTLRMPRIDELPLPAQNEIKQQRGELADDHPEKRRMTLMQR